MKLTEYGRQVIERAMMTRKLTHSALVEQSKLSVSVVDSFTTGKQVNQESFVLLCNLLQIEPALICELEERTFPGWFSLFLRDFCYPMNVGIQGFTYIIKGDRFQPVIQNPVGVQVKFVSRLCIVKLNQDRIDELDCFDIPEDGAVFMKRLFLAVEALLPSEPDKT